MTSKCKLSSSAPSNLSTLDVKLVGAEQAGTALLYAVAKADMHMPMLPLCVQTCAHPLV